MVEDKYSTIMYVCSYMMKSEKAMGEALKRVPNKCQNDDIQTKMNKIKNEFLGKRVFWSSQISNTGPINVADEEKQKSNISQYKYER